MDHIIYSFTYREKCYRDYESELYKPIKAALEAVDEEKAPDTSDEKNESKKTAAEIDW